MSATIHRTDTQRAAAYGRLLAEAAAVIYDPSNASYATRAYQVRRVLIEAGIHGAQVDGDGQPVAPPHDPGCKECEQEATT